VPPVDEDQVKPPREHPRARLYNARKPRAAFEKKNKKNRLFR
jgi:hypothetical protein